MKTKITRLLFSAALMMCCMNVWAETKTVSYRYPVYNIDGEHTSGIKEWQTGTVDATVITNNTTTLDDGWYVVTGDNVSTGELWCYGRVHLILADGAKLTATGGENRAGILTVNDTLTIYGQSAQSGQLIANGGENAAGIGGRDGFNSCEIFINGGMVTANGGKNAAGIGSGSGLLAPILVGNRTIIINGGMVTAKGGENAAGIGGGNKVDGEYIVINGGMVTAYGDNGGAGIGGGYEGSSYGITINDGAVIANGGMMIDGKTSYVEGIGSGIGGGYKGSTRVIYVAAALTLYAGSSNPPSSQIPHTYHQDIAGNLAGKRYVIVKDEIAAIKESAIAAINAAIEGVTYEDIIDIATNAINAINASNNLVEIATLKERALAAIASAKATYASVLGELGTPQTGCAAVKVTKGDKEVILYAPDNVKVIKIPANK